MNAIETDAFVMLDATAPALKQAMLDDVKSRENADEATFRALLGTQATSPGVRSGIESLKAVRDSARRTTDDEVLPLLLAGKKDAAEALLLGPQLVRLEKARRIVVGLSAEADRRTRRSVLGALARSAWMVRLIVAVGLASVVCGIGQALLLDGMISRPLRDVARLADRIGAGDLTADVPATRRADEVGILTGAFRGMVEKLRGLNRETREGIEVLGSSANEIVAVATQVAAGAAEAAVAVNQTTTTVEEVKRTAELSAEKAQAVSQSAQKSVAVSQTGTKSVEETIALSIAKLSDQSLEIGEIIASVNELAEQSNLLAVNAAIEAAKAGELGRGFAVVAREIKALADQSRRATVRIRAILGENQKATASAVMATEQGIRAVEAGSRQSSETAEAIQALAGSIAEAALAATQIAASSQQQLVGMDQIAQAMESIKEASAQTAASTKQTQAAAQDLHGLGARLKHLVEQFSA